MATLSLKLKDPLYAQVRQTSQDLGVSLSAFVREALEERLKQLAQQTLEEQLRLAAKALSEEGSGESEVWGEAPFCLPDEPIWWREPESND